MNYVTIQLSLTVTSSNGKPIQIHKRLPIALGRNLDGTPMISLFDDPGTQGVGVLAVEIDLPGTCAFEFPSRSLMTGITVLSPDGKPRTYENAVSPQPKSTECMQLELLQAEYKSGNSGS